MSSKSEDPDYESSESEVYSEYTDSDRSADEVNETSESDGGENVGDLSEGEAFDGLKETLNLLCFLAMKKTQKLFIKKWPPRQ